MNMLPRIFIALYVLLFTKSTTQNILQKNTSLEDNDWKQLKEWMSHNDTNSPISVDVSTTGRDKRALGIFLQGLVQALGYNSTPIQLATLPNPNTRTINTDPINLDIRNTNSPSLSPSPPVVPLLTVATGPKQRETLRFTGVVNFGNNSDILGHLRQYEQIFHSSTSTSSPIRQQSSSQSAPISKSPNGSNIQGLNALLEPYFIPIPIPLSPNIQNVENLKYPQKPLFSIIPVQKPVNRANLSTILTTEYSNKEHEETHDVRSEEIIQERNPNVDKRKNNNGEIIQSNKIKSEQSVNTENEDSNQSGEYDEDRKPDYSENENNKTLSEQQTSVASEEDVSEVDNPKKDYKSEETDELDNSEEKKQPNSENSSEEDDASEADENLDKHEEETFESPSQKLPLKADISNEEEERRKNLFQDAEEYTPKQIPNLYLINLPIEEKPIRAPFMNSYGQSLEHEGRIDENIADYFRNYKNAQFRIFDGSSISPEIRPRPWWIDDTSRNLIEKISNEYNSTPQKKYEEYELSRSSKTGKNQEAARHAAHQEVKQASTSNEDQLASIELNEGKKRRVQKERTSDNNKRDKLTESIEMEKRRNSEIPFELPPLQTFDFIKYSPYSVPVQYLFPPESLERSAQAIITRSNLEKHKNSDKKINPKEMEGKFDTPALQQHESKEIKAWLIPFYVTNTGDTESSEDSSLSKNIENTEYSNSENSSIVLDRPQLSIKSPISHEQKDENSNVEYNGRNEPRITDEPSIHIASNVQVQTTPFFERYEDQIVPKKVYRLNNSTRHEYMINRSEPIKNLHLSIYKNPGVYLEPPYMSHRSQSTVDYSNSYPEESSSNTYQIKQIKIPITTYNPTTYQFRPTIINDHVDNITQRNQRVSSSNHENTYNDNGKDQPQYYISYAKTFPIESNMGETSTPIDGHIFGQRIDQSRQEHQTKSSNINEHNYGISSSNHRVPIPLTKRIVNLSRNERNRSEFFSR